MCNGDVMKKLAVLALIVMFLGNTVVMSAWAKPCMSDSSIEMMQEMSAGMDSDMPCHDEKSQNKTNHCDGVCLCLHASLNQTLITNDVAALALFDISKQQIIISQDVLTSRTTLPPRRPPKFIS